MSQAPYMTPYQFDSRTFNFEADTHSAVQDRSNNLLFCGGGVKWSMRSWLTDGGSLNLRGMSSFKLPCF